MAGRGTPGPRPYGPGRRRAPAGERGVLPELVGGAAAALLIVQGPEVSHMIRIQGLVVTAAFASQLNLHLRALPPDGGGVRTARGLAVRSRGGGPQ